MHEAFLELDHRPWPLPKGNWAWRQSWLDLAFIHYRVSPSLIRNRIPGELQLQEFDGSAWVGVVPFRMSGVMKRPLPDIPGFSSFPELNVRTYVEYDGMPGVWFFRLFADCWPVVWGGQYIYGLPYKLSKMEHRLVGEDVSFTSMGAGGSKRFEAIYGPVGGKLDVIAGSFEHWATERYCLYSCSRRKGLSRVQVHHVKWPLRNAQIKIKQSTVLTDLNIEPESDECICHYSSGVHVVSYPKESVL